MRPHTAVATASAKVHAHGDYVQGPVNAGISRIFDGSYAASALRDARPRADEPGSGRVSPARLQHQPAKTGVAALMSSDALCARTIALPRWPLAFARQRGRAGASTA